MATGPDFEALERAQKIHARFQALLELGEEDTNQLFLRQAALVFRLQQDVYVKFGVNLAEYIVSLGHVKMEAKVDEAVESRGTFFHKGWVQAHKSNDVEATVIFGLLTSACEFWITARFAQLSELRPLKMCALNNHLLLASVPKADVMTRAKRYPNMFFETGEYEFAKAHWPYIDVDLLVQDYKNATDHNGPLAQQFIKLLRSD